MLIAVNLNGDLAGESVVELNGTEVDIRQQLKEVQGFVYGDMTSVAVSPDGSRLAVAIQAERYADEGEPREGANADDPRGSVSIVTIGGDGSLSSNSVYFNASNDKTAMDNRSGKKDPEPESVVTGVVDGRTCAFIALERIGGMMVYDVTDPAQAARHYC